MTRGAFIVLLATACAPRAAGGASVETAPGHASVPRPLTQERTDHVAPVVEHTCHEPWPQNRADPRVGFYIARGADTDPFSHSLPGRYLVYDGRTVVLLWLVWYPGCERPGPVVNGWVRLAARVVGDVLQARALCVGWVDVARFEEGGRMVALLTDEHPALYRATPAMVPECERERWLRCSPIVDEAAGEGPPPEYTAPYSTPSEARGLPSIEECMLRDAPLSSDGREGFYATSPFDIALEPTRRTALQYALFDGATLVMRYDPDARNHRRCVAGHVDDLSPGIHRFAARVVGDDLMAELPCEGWTTVGRFDGRVLHLEGVPEPLHRDRSPTCEHIPYAVCRSVYSPALHATDGEPETNGQDPRPNDGTDHGSRAPAP